MVRLLRPHCYDTDAVMLLYYVYAVRRFLKEQGMNEQVSEQTNKRTHFIYQTCNLTAKLRSRLRMTGDYGTHS